MRVVLLVRGVEAVRGQVWGGWAGGPEVWDVEGHFAQERPYLCKESITLRITLPDDCQLHIT